MKVVLFVAAFVIAVWPSLAPVPTQAVADYLPLKAGSEYVYDWKDGDQTGTVTRRVKTVRIQNSTYFVFVDIEEDKEETKIFGSFPWDGPIRKTDVGVVGMLALSLDDPTWPKEDKPYLFLALPLREGAKTEALSTTFTIEGFEDVEVSGRSYRHCARVRQKPIYSKADTYWLAPEVGIVKWQSYHTTVTTTGRLETLARYTIPK